MSQYCVPRDSVAGYLSDEPVKVLVIYAPPYGESPDKAIRSTQP
jgi:hypothetical protein